MELYTDTQNCEAVNGALSPFVFLFCSLLLADALADEFSNEFATEFVIKFFPNSYL